MKGLYIMTLFSLLFFSCTQKKEVHVQTKEALPRQESNNALYSFFDTIIKVFPAKEIKEVQDYYFIFKKTDSNDTLFQFSYFASNDIVFEKSGYKGFLQIDSFNVAIYDDENIGLEWYKDNLRKKPFPNTEKYIIDNKEKEEHSFNEKEERVFKMHILSIGWVKNSVFEELPATKVAREGWNRYFD